MMETPNSKGFEDFGSRAGEGKPVTMLNLLAFEPDGLPP